MWNCPPYFFLCCYLNLLPREFFIRSLHPLFCWTFVFSLFDCKRPLRRAETSSAFLLVFKPS